MPHRFSKAFGQLINERISENPQTWSDVIDECRLYGTDIQFIENNLNSGLFERVLHAAHALGIRFHVEETTYLEDQKRWRELTKDIKRSGEAERGEEDHKFLFGDDADEESIPEVITEVPEGVDTTDPFWHQREDIWPAKSDKLGYLGDTAAIEITPESSDPLESEKTTGHSKPSDTVILYNTETKTARSMARADYEALKAASENRPTAVYLSSLPKNANRDQQREYAGYASIEGRINLFVNTEITEIRTRLVDEFPYATNIIDGILGDILVSQSMGKRFVSFNPFLLVGPPGLGKTRLARRLCEEIGIYHKTISVAGMHDANIFGTSKGWGTASASIITEAVFEAKYANPVIIMDEIEKVSRDNRNGSIHQKLLGLLERSEAKNWLEPYFGVSVDASHINWLFTANSLEGVPAPLRSRVRVLEMKAPEAEHIPAILRAMRSEIAHEQGVNVRFIPDFDVAEMDAVKQSYVEHKNIRIVRSQAMSLLSNRNSSKH